MRTLQLSCLALIIVSLFSSPAISQSLHGIDLSDLDRKAEPCTDFYEFANGTWRANNPIPASMTRWSKRWAAGESSKDKLRDILEETSANNTAPKGSTEQIIGDYYAACMDESRVNARGMEPLKPWFAKIDAARDTAALQQVMVEMHDILITDPFGLGSQQDPHRPSWVLADIGASGLGLPDRDYYLKPEDRFKEARAKYLEHVTAMFKLVASDQKTAAAAAHTIMNMETKPRGKRRVESTDNLLGEALGKKYVEKYFPPEAKARMQEMVRNLLAAMRDDILSRPWMSDDTKEKAMAKVATFNPKIGYPDKWKDYSHVEIRRDAFFEDMIAGRKFVESDDRALIGKPVDRGRWGMTPTTSDASYSTLMNEIVFPAGILQPPAFDLNALDAVNYGAIGVVIGHEISHGFDDEGAQFDYLGRLRNWWTEADLKNF